MSIRSKDHHGMVFTGIISKNKLIPVDQPKKQLEINTHRNPPSLSDKVDRKLDFSNVPERTKEEEDETEEEDSVERINTWPFASNAKKTPQENHLGSFFPIFFNNLGRSRNSPSSIAIANAFSTGKNGIANSIASAQGVPENRNSFASKQRRMKTTTKPRTITSPTTTKWVQETTTKYPELFTTQNYETTTNFLDTTTNYFSTTPSYEYTTIPEYATLPSLQLNKKKTPESEEIFPSKEDAKVNYFPISFGRNDGSVAIANSFSNGESNSQAQSRSAKYKNPTIFPIRVEATTKQTTTEIPTTLRTTTFNDFLVETTPTTVPPKIKPAIAYFPFVIDEFSGKNMPNPKIVTDSRAVGENIKNEIAALLLHSKQNLQTLLENEEESPKEILHSGGFYFFPVNLDKISKVVTNDESFLIDDNKSARMIREGNNLEKTTTEEFIQEVTTEGTSTTPLDLFGTTEKTVLTKKVEEKPRNRNRGNYNYFPISFGNQRSIGNPIGTVAIANSYSTGRGGVASSSSTAFGTAFSSKRT